jgi:hypothetical protein
MSLSALPTIKKTASVLFIVGVSATLIMGILFRSWGVVDTPLDFWADEALWAYRLTNLPIKLLSIRPFGFMYLSKALSQLGPNHELLLRLPSYIGGWQRNSNPIPLKCLFMPC